MKKSLIALAFGTLGLGIAEFVMMGILPDVAKDLGISIPMAGHFIWRTCTDTGSQISVETYSLSISHLDYGR